MSKYTTTHHEAAFGFADDVYANRCSASHAVSELTERHGIADATAKDFIECYRRLRRGLVYKRGLSEGATRCFLDGIESRHGSSSLAIAIQAADAHLEYRKTIGNNLPGLIELVDEFRKRLTGAVLTMPDEMASESLVEGDRVTVFVSRIERNPVARQKCIDHHGKCCCVCGFDFAKMFGEIGEGFIHVHHLNPVSKAQVPREVDPIRDLRPICPNCHAMAHREDPPIGIERLQEIRRCP